MEIIEYLKIRKSGRRKKIVGRGHNVGSVQVVKDVAEDGDSQWDPVLPRGIRFLLGSLYTKYSILYRVFCNFLFSCISWNFFFY